MPQNITTHVSGLVEAAERVIETLSTQDALALHGRDDGRGLVLRREHDDDRVRGGRNCHLRERKGEA